MMKRLGVAIALFAALVLAACEPAESEVNVPRYLGEPNGDDAALVGTIVVEEPCLFVETDSGERLLIAFPASASDWDDDARELSLGDRKFKAGDRVFFGGSSATAEFEDRFDWQVRPSNACEADLTWISQATARVASEVP